MDHDCDYHASSWPSSSNEDPPPPPHDIPAPKEKGGQHKDERRGKEGRGEGGGGTHPTNPSLGALPTWEAGFSFPGGGGGSIEPSGRTPPKGAQLTGPWKNPKTGAGISVVPMSVVLLLPDKRPPVNFGYMYVAPHHGLPSEPDEPIRLRLASTIMVRVRDIVEV